MSFAIITNFHFPCLAHTKAIVIIRNQILRTAVQGISQMCDFIRAVRKLHQHGGFVSVEFHRSWPTTQRDRHNVPVESHACLVRGFGILQVAQS